MDYGNTYGASELWKYGEQGLGEDVLSDLRERLDEHLRDEDIEDDLLKLPVSEILERICGYLEIAPVWGPLAGTGSDPP
jgi:hypothetical protein